MLRRITNLVVAARVRWDIHGQDLIEYALMAGFVAVAAGALMPDIADAIGTIIEQVKRVLRDAARDSSG